MYTTLVVTDNETKLTGLDSKVIPFERFPAPVLKVVLPNEAGGFAIENLSPGELSTEEREVLLAKLRTLTEKVWRSPKQRKYRWDMAILYDPEEAMAPSDAGAIQRFIRAAAKVGIDAEAIRSRDMINLTQYDAVFAFTQALPDEA